MSHLVVPALQPTQFRMDSFHIRHTWLLAWEVIQAWLCNKTAKIWHIFSWIFVYINNIKCSSFLVLLYLLNLNKLLKRVDSWWRHQMETFSALLAICAGNSPVPGEFPAQRPVTRSFDVFFDLRLNKRLSKRSWGWWFETLSRPLWRHHNAFGDLVFSLMEIS